MGFFSKRCVAISPNVCVSSFIRFSFLGMYLLVHLFGLGKIRIKVKPSKWGGFHLGTYFRPPAKWTRGESTGLLRKDAATPIAVRVFGSWPSRPRIFCRQQAPVCWPSGKSCSVSLPAPNASRVREVKAEAQQQFQRRFLSLAFRGQQLDQLLTLRDAGLQDGDTIAAVVQPVQIACP